jgi:hypothetical protein
VKQKLTAVAVFELAVGVGVIIWWVFVSTTGRVPELEAGERSIWFHIAAELLMAALLIIGGIRIRTNAPRARLASALALGTLVYSGVNSAGYFADDGSWGMVSVLVLVAAAAGLAFVRVVRAAIDDGAETPSSIGV